MLLEIEWLEFWLLQFVLGEVVWMEFVLLGFLLSEKMLWQIELLELPSQGIRIEVQE